MSKKIIRKQLEIVKGPQRFSFGYYPKVIHCTGDRKTFDRIDIWAEVHADYQQELVQTEFYVFEAGDLIPDNYDYVDTVVMRNRLVWHVYMNRNVSST